MSTYESGFASGELQAFKDRKRGLSRTVPQFEVTDPYARGYWDGYRPRSATWAISQEVRAVWEVREQSE